MTSNNGKTALDEVLRALWLEIVGPDYSPDSSFFDAGGDSLAALRLVSGVRSRLQLELPLATLYAHPTPSALASALAALPSSAQLTPSAVAARGLSGRGDPPASFAQEARLARDLRARENGQEPKPQILVQARELCGRLDLDRLQMAVHSLASRHDTLRSSFYQSDNGDILQHAHVMPASSIVQVHPRRVSSRAAETALVERGWTLFSPMSLPPWQVLVYRIDRNKSIVAIAIDHLLADAESLAIMWKQLASLYGADEQTDTEICPFWSWAVWQREWVNTNEGLGDRAFWHKALEGRSVVPYLHIPGQPARHDTSTFRGDSIMLPLPATVPSALRKTLPGTTLASAVLSAVMIVLRQVGNNPDVAIETAVQNRGFSEIQDTIGWFANIVVIRAIIEHSHSFRDVLALVSEQATGAYDHARYPFHLLVRELEPTAYGRSQEDPWVFFTAFSPAAMTLNWGDEVTDAPLPINLRRAAPGLSITLLDGERPELRVGFESAWLPRSYVGLLTDFVIQVLEAGLATPELTVATLGRRAPRLRP